MDKGDPDLRSRFTVILEQFDHLPAVFAFCKLLQAPPSYSAAVGAGEGTSTTEKIASTTTTAPSLSLSSLRLIELTDRTSALMKASSTPSTLLASDTLSTILRTFTSSTLGIPTTSHLSIVPGESFASTVAQHAEGVASEMLVLPWALKESQQEAEGEGYFSQVQNPFAGLFGAKGAREESPVYASFVRKVFAEGESGALTDLSAPWLTLCSTCSGVRCGPLCRPRRRGGALYASHWPL